MSGVLQQVNEQSSIGISPTESALARDRRHHSHSHRTPCNRQNGKETESSFINICGFQMGLVLPLVTPHEGVFRFALPQGHTPPWGVTVWRCDSETSLADEFGV